MDVTVISIGTLAKNPLWEEKVPVRTSHATTSLVRTGNEAILVDPSLPAQTVESRLFERTGAAASTITKVFLTNWRPAHRRGLALFEKAVWLMNETEIVNARRILDELRRRNEDTGNDAEIRTLVETEARLLSRVEAAPDELAEGVSLFPLPGYTEGQSGLLVAEAMRTTVIAGDAVPTAGHFFAGRVFEDCWDVEKAKASLGEMYEIADIVVPGHDNIFVAPRVHGA
jgi:glyoxylase-like metal-dependent hydrolase (beta-lactamase superfamily II)